MTPTTFSSNKIGALIIFWIDSPVAIAVFTPSNTAACRTAEKLLLISGRLSRAVRAASVELLVSGMNPTFFSTCGTRKYRCLRRCETASSATSSAFTRSSLAIFSATAGKDRSTAPAPSDFRASASRSSSDTRLVLMCSLLSPQLAKESFCLRGEPPSAAIYVCLRLFASAARIFLIVCAVRSDTSACIVPANCLY